MTELEANDFPKVLRIYLELSQYPILAEQVREHMRQELFKRGVISPEVFETEVEEKAIESQKREGLDDPYAQEPIEDWINRQSIVRDHLTDFYFAYNLPHELFEDLLRHNLSQRTQVKDVVLSIHPELAPFSMLFTQGAAFESLPSKERKRVEHHLKEIKVVLIKAMISDHLRYVGIAKEWFDIADLQRVRSQRLGRGKIGGKAAGMLLAERILQETADKTLLENLCTPQSWFLGADVFYQFTQRNGLQIYANQKYKREDEIRPDYPIIKQRFQGGQFPEDILKGLQSILDRAGKSPLIVRSSSLLEDSFDTSFAGKYESVFCPNQGAPEENLTQLLNAIRGIYASVYSPDALLYRRRMKLLDYDERMAIMIQEVYGRTFGTQFLPDAAGVAFSRNQFRWSPKIDREAGFVRMVWGLGTQAIEQTGAGHPRLVALSHPTMWPTADTKRIRRYAQRSVDLIDVEVNAFRTRPVKAIVQEQTPHLRLLAQTYQDDYLQDFISRPLQIDPEEVTITFDGLLRHTRFAEDLRVLLAKLEEAYGRPVDIEFACTLETEPGGNVRPIICLLQCRPQSQLQVEVVQLPEHIPVNQRIFTTHHMVPDGSVSGVRYAIYVLPKGYYTLPRSSEKHEVARLIGRINRQLEGQPFILLGPGRWGSNNPDLGIPVTYSEIHHARALIEVVEDEMAPEPSYGTHFFQDLVESRIFPLALAMDDPMVEFNQEFFENAPNSLTSLLPEATQWEHILKIIDIPAVSDGALLELRMNGDRGRSIAYLNIKEDPG
jgi:hypothetical protein